MTALHSPLVERVAEAIAASIYRSEGLETMNYAGVEDYCRREWKHYASEAQAAVAACHADLADYLRQERAKLTVREDLAGTYTLDAAVTAIDAMLAKLEGRA
jgi:hypothetical protein